MFRDVFEISNDQAFERHVDVEPWAMRYSVKTGETIRFEASSSGEGKFEIVTEHEHTMIYGWCGSTLQVFRGGELIDEFPVPVPSLPKGVSVRRFLGIVFDR